MKVAPKLRVYYGGKYINREIAVPTSATSNKDVNEQESSNLDNAFLSGTFVHMSNT